MSTVDIIRIITLILTLGYASYSDLMARRVKNWVWVPGFGIAFILIGYEIYFYSLYEVIIPVGISVIVIGVISYLLFYFRLFYGADYKALILIAFLVPVQPEILNYPIYNFGSEFNISVFMDIGSIYELFIVVSEFFVFNTFGFTVFVNSVLFSSIYFVFNIYFNLRDNNFSVRRPLRSICAKKIDSRNVCDEYVQVIERSETDRFIKRGIVFIKNSLNGISGEFYRDYLDWYRSQKFNDSNATIDDINSIDMESFADDNEEWIIKNPEKDKKSAEIVLKNDSVWITQGIPYIVPILLGSISAIIFGNIWFIFIYLI